VTIEIEGRIYYKTLEACKETGISRPTLFRWLKTGVIEKSYRNRRGWRLFTEEDLNKIKTEVRTIKVEYSYPGEKNDRVRHN
jgi:DNA-binding transcriptional MerR regulator